MDPGRSVHPIVREAIWASGGLDEADCREIYFALDEAICGRWSEVRTIRDVCDMFRQSASQSGGGIPYIVVFGPFWPSTYYMLCVPK